MYSPKERGEEYATCEGILILKGFLEYLEEEDGF